MFGTVEELQWRPVEVAVAHGKAIVWDGCHKIYVAMDEEQVDLFCEYEYAHIAKITEADAAVAQLREWFEDSCSLRFISAVRTVEGDPNDGFTDLIGQFEL